jgi:hypothetical protein
MAALAARPAGAQSPVAKLGEFQGWTAYAVGKDASRICYIVGEASGDANGRSVRYAYVAHRPAKKAWSVVMIYPGTAYKDASEATVEIGKNQFALFTYRDTAWAPDADLDARLVKAMRAGKTMVVRGIDGSGAVIADQYSLAGFLAAYRRIGEACNLK